MNSQNINDNLKTYLKTKYYDHLVDVLRQMGSNSLTLKICPNICHKIIIRHHNFCLKVITHLRINLKTISVNLGPGPYLKRFIQVFIDSTKYKSRS